MRQTAFRLIMWFLLCSNTFAAEIIDTGALLGEYPVIRWMDNHRVIFLAASGQTCNRKDKPDSYKQLLNRIAIFDTQTRQLNWHGGVGVNGLCYADGNIAYARRLVSDGLCPKDEWVYYRGRFGEEKVQQPPVPTDSYSCLPEAEVRPTPAWLETAKKSGRIFRSLKPEHGWVEMAVHFRGGARANPEYPAKILKPDGNSIPIDDVFREHLKEGFYLNQPDYVAAKNAYLVKLFFYTTLPANSYPLPAWWLHPDGSVSNFKLQTPANLWVGMIGGFIFTKQGALLFRNSANERLQAENGLYLDALSPVKLVSGDIQNYAVSPNGCKVAYGVDPRGFWSQGPRHYRLQLIDVCERNSK